MPVRMKLRLTLALSAGILLCAAVLAGCDIKTYNMTDPGRPADAFSAFYRAVSDGDDDTANQLLYNYSWKSYMPQTGASGDSHTVNGTEVSGSDARVMTCLLQSRKCSIVSESDYTKDDMNAAVTVSYTSFDISKFQSQLNEQAVETVKKKQYDGQVFKDKNDTKDMIEEIKNRLLDDPGQFTTTRPFRIELINVKGKWQVILTEDFYKALLGYAS